MDELDVEDSSCSLPEISGSSSEMNCITQDGEDAESLSKPYDNDLQLLESFNVVTTHFAHVQFRLRQIIDAPLAEKEALLKELEQFTFKGIPEIQKMTAGQTSDNDQTKDRLIDSLKKQIEELEDSIKGLNVVKDGAILAQDNGKVNGEHENMSKILDTHRLKSQFQQINLMKKLSSIVHMMNVHCTQEKKQIPREYIPKKPQHNHWGDLRAQLEIAIGEVIDLALEPECPIDSDYMSDSECGSLYVNSQKLAVVVRKKLAVALQNLMQHGLVTESKSISVRSSLSSVIGCMPHINTSSQRNQNVHAWELILNYYRLKNGDKFNSSPALKLSQSYNLDVGVHCTTSSTQKLLITIGSIISSHSVFKRSHSSQFKAFVCAGLNTKMLVNWLQSIYRSKPLIDTYYEPWSYAMKTGFEDVFKSMEKLNHYHFNLPVDVAIYQLQNIRDAF